MTARTLLDFLIGTPTPTDDARRDDRRRERDAGLPQGTLSEGPGGIQYGIPLPGLGPAFGAASSLGRGAGVAQGAMRAGSSLARHPFRTAAGIGGGVGVAGGLALRGQGGGASGPIQGPPAPTAEMNWIKDLAQQRRDRGGPPGAGGNPSSPIDSAEARLRSQLQNLDANFNAQRDQLRDMFQFAETPQEQALLAFQLGDLEEQRKAGTEIIANEYGKASGFAGSQAGKMRETATAEGEARGEIYSDAAARAGDAIDQLAGEYVGSGMGVGAVPVSGDATDWVGMLEAAGGREQALATNLGNIAADDMAALGVQLQGEGSAQSGALQRAALGLRADATMRHHQQVAQRQAAEQAAFRQALMQLQGQQFDRQFRLEDRLFDLDLHRFDAQQRQQERGGDPAQADPTGASWTTLEWAAHFEQNPAALGPAHQGLLGPRAQQVATAIAEGQASGFGAF